MQLEVILPLVAYLVVVFGISVYAMRKRSTGTFLNEYFLGGDLFKFGKRITVNNGLSLITKPGRFTSCSHGHSLCDTYKKGASPCRVAPF